MSQLFYFACFVPLFIVFGVSQGFMVNLSCLLYNQEWEHVGKLFTCLNEDIHVDHPDTEIDQVLDSFGNDISDECEIEGIEIKKTIVKVIPKGIKKLCPQLKAISFHNTGIVSVKPDDMKQFGSDLEYISLSANKIIALDANIFTDNVNLKFINLRSNNLRFIESQFFENIRKLSELKAVNLIDCTCINRYFESADLITKTNPRIGNDNKCNDASAKNDENTRLKSMLDIQAAEIDVRFGEKSTK